METKKFLQATEVFIVNDTIIDTKVINDTLYIADSNNLYVLDKYIKKISSGHSYYLDALENEGNQLIFMELDKNKQKIIFNNKNTKYEIILSQLVKKLFMFYNKGYGIILFEDNSIDIYSINFNKVITNIKLSQNITNVFKSFSTNKLILISKHKLSIFDIETLNISRTIDIQDSSYFDVSFIEDTIYLIYNDKIKIINKDYFETDIKIEIDDKVIKVFTNIYQKEIIIVTKNNSIYLYHLSSYSLFKVLTKKTPIKEIRFIQSDLFIISEDKIIKIDTTQGALEFEKHLVLEEIDEAFMILKDNPFLILDEVFFQSLNKLWRDKYNKISNNLLMNKIDEAKKLFKIFESIYTYKKDFEEIFSLSDILLHLSRSLRAINYKEVFNLIEQNPSLEKTPIGKKILNDWEQNFEKFILALLKDNFDKQSKEYKSLQKYFEVYSKKQLILFSIEHQEVILSTIQAFKNKKYSLYTKLMDKYFFLDELPITKKIHIISHNIYLKVLKYIAINELNDSLPMIETLQNFSYYKDKALILKEKVNVFIGFEASYEKANFERCRMFLEQYSEHFNGTSYYYNILLLDTKKIESSIFFIDNNDFEKAYLILQEFFKSQIWASKVKYLMISYYKQQFKFQEQTLSVDSQRVFIDKFYNLFGYIDTTFPKVEYSNIYKGIIPKEHIMNYPKILL